MKIIWDEEKNNWLQLNRNVSFEEISEKILNKDYLEIIVNPTRDDQLYFILDIQNYIWVVPFLINDNEELILKTAYPSRKYYKKYRSHI